MKFLLALAVSIFTCSTLSAQNQLPNVLLIIADDLGIDVINGFGIDGPKPITPHLDALRENGLAYTNCWATPQCTPTRAAIMSGKYGIKTGIMKPPGELGVEHTSLFNQIKDNVDANHNMAVIGKWHIALGQNYDHPSDIGVDHYEGLFNSSVDDYRDWTKVANGDTSRVTEYATSHLTDAAIDWVQNQNQPWFLWLAHIAPHGPFHEPPADLYSTEPVDNVTRYFAMIEAMDHEIGRLLDSLDEETLNNTIIFFIGDNGTPNGVSDFYPQGHAKGSIHEGGIRVPMIASGKNVLRKGEIESGLVQVTDLHATILELLGMQLPGGINNSLSIKSTLSCENAVLRNINYSDYNDDGTLVWATRTGQYKLLEDENGNQEFYDIILDIKEENDLIDLLTPDQLTIKNMLEAEAAIIRSDWSCQDGIQNGDETTIDDCDNQCSVVDELSFDNIGCCEEPSEPSIFYEFIEDTLRHIYSNSFPNHDYCYGATMPEPNYKLYRVDKNPVYTGQKTEVVRENGRPARFFGVAKNGVFFMPAPGVPFIFENQNTGEYNWDWVFEPTTNQGAGMGKVSLDCASAHANSQGYHYHGNMFEYLETIVPGSSTTDEIPNEVIHVGWASDGFPILYRFGPDEDGNMKELMPSFQLRPGLRPGDGLTEPCGPYTGKYTRDYEYICGKGDLNECNGIQATVTINTSQGPENFDYYYVITSSFPQIPRCLLGRVSEDFNNSASSLVGADVDGDGFIDTYDCDDNDPLINPLAVEIEGNDVDENCDGLLSSTFDLNAIGVTLGPNPNNGSFWVDLPQGKIYELSLSSTAGKLLNKKTGQEKLMFRNLASGTYLLQINAEGQLLGSAKIVVL